VSEARRAKLRGAGAAPPASTARRSGGAAEGAKGPWRAGSSESQKSQL